MVSPVLDRSSFSEYSMIFSKGHSLYSFLLPAGTTKKDRLFEPVKMLFAFVLNPKFGSWGLLQIIVVRFSQHENVPELIEVKVEGRITVLKF